MTWNLKEVVDPTVYTGLLGTAFTCLRSYQVTGNQKDLQLCAEIVDTCATVARASLRYTLLCFHFCSAFVFAKFILDFLGGGMAKMDAVVVSFDILI